MSESKTREEVRGFATMLRIFNNKLNGLLFHNLFKHLIIRNRKNSRIVIINSNINYYEKSCPKLIASLTKHGLRKEDIIIMVGGYTAKVESDFMGVKTYQLDNNSIDYSAFIGLLELGLTSKFDFFFYIHDTTVIDSNKFSSVFYKYPLKNNYSYSIGTFISMNTGIYSKESLLKSKDFILSTKNTDYSAEAIYRSKAQGCEWEDQLFRNNKTNHLTLFGGYSFPKVKQAIYEGQERIEENYQNIGILKYKLNANPNKKLITTLG